MITKKHLKELADIVYMAQQKKAAHAQAQIKIWRQSQAKLKVLLRTRPQLSESHWNDYLYKKDQEILKKAGWLK